MHYRDVCELVGCTVRVHPTQYAHIVAQCGMDYVDSLDNVLNRFWWMQSKGSDKQTGKVIVLQSIKYLNSPPCVTARRAMVYLNRFECLIVPWNGMCLYSRKFTEKRTSEYNLFWL